MNSLKFVKSYLVWLKQVIFFMKVTIETSKERVKFSIEGENGKGSICLNARDSNKPEEIVILDIEE